MREVVQDVAMTYARSQMIDARNPGTYHCISRCVRRAFLCGHDKLSGRDFNHRKVWVEQRLIALADCFAVSILAYAIMSNHFHVVTHIQPQLPEKWSDREVAIRWLRAFPGLLRNCQTIAQTKAVVANLLEDQQWVAKARQRLGSLSWFMRALNEPIARRANKEDNCTGRFWEGRFKCQALLDQRAILACMAYVDLNPFRAQGKIDTERTNPTSLTQRIQGGNQRKSEKTAGTKIYVRLQPVAGCTPAHALAVSEDEYLELVTWTAIKAYHFSSKPSHSASKGPCSIETPSWLMRQKESELAWVVQVKGTERLFYRAIGSALRLTQHAKVLGQNWLKGISTARLLAAMP